MPLLLLEYSTCSKKDLAIRGDKAQEYFCIRVTEERVTSTKCPYFKENLYVDVKCFSAASHSISQPLTASTIVMRPPLLLHVFHPMTFP